LRRHTIFPVFKQFTLLLFALMAIITGCSLEKKNGFNRFMQNVTAQYNILFNANEIIRLKQVSYATSFVDNYNEVLSVYQDTTPQSTTPDKDLEAAIAKGNSIITIKEQSHYLGDAYLVLGKANYLEGNYYNAVEYFSYVIRSFPENKNLLREALLWKGRTLMYIDKLPEAKPVLDSAIAGINPKKKIHADIYATKLQYDIDVQDYVDGEEMAKQAVHYCSDKPQRLRWTFVLAQLQELNNKPAEAAKNYRQLAKSDALFEMAFNASLNLIRIQDMRNGVKIDRTQELLSLLKNPNNKEFKDQIYYQVAQIYMADKNIDQAVKYYNLSLRATIRNQNQKGLSYLRLAELYFNNKADYVRAKKYYDSTLTTLPTNYPGYTAIQKKGNNLALLADRLQIVTREDTLQALARMDEKTRSAIIDKMVSDEILQRQAASNAAAGNASLSAGSGNGGPSSSFTGGSFYFDNASTVGQGYTDFKQKWGARKLEDNWRRSSRSSGDITANSANSTQASDPDAPINAAQANKTTLTAGGYRKALIQGLPLTPDLLAASNTRIYNAYMDIGNFYRDVLEDKKEAIAAYELILRRDPDNPNNPAVYYNLYRLYSELDPAKSDQYKNKLLKDYAETPFAKIISDPDFVKKLDDADAEFTQAYNVIFDLFDHKEYKDVVACVPELLKLYPGNKLSAQLYYLQTIAAGHNEKVGPFTDSLKSILNKFPNDRLISPLVTQHLTYINANQAELEARAVVLPDEDPNEIPFTLAPDLKKEAALKRAQRPPGPVFQQTPVKAPEKKPVAVTKQPEVKAPENKPAAVTPPVVQPADNKQAAVTPPAVQPPDNKQPVVTPPVVQPPDNKQAAVTVTPQPEIKTQDNQAIATAPAVQPPITEAQGTTVVKRPFISNLFSMRDSTDYYFVVNVASSTTNLSSSRFGIGQFNRTNYQGKGIKHLLRDVDDNQLITVGHFTSLAQAKDYARQIAPLLPDIMKVPVDKYSFFIITKENLDKLANKQILDSYVDYYQNNY